MDSPRIDIRSLPAIPRPERVLMTSPEHFDVEYVINPHMEGNIGAVDPERARAQWNQLRDTYERLGFTVSSIPGVEGLPDMVFCANQTLPYLTPGGKKGVVLSRMFAPQRRDEVPYYARFFEEEGYRIDEVDATAAGESFEGMGDALWHPGRFLLWGGYGFRTDRTVYDHLASDFGFPVLPVSLTDPDFYHLDTCLAPLNEVTALVYPGAFDEEGLEVVRAHFRHVLEAPENEARELFACNAHCPDGRNVIIQRGCAETSRKLRDAGFDPVEVDTDEYLKSGGSVFCMKVMFW
jgi:N-dimethylarginine dimethylaminohydrolase